mmetsp:Transcript_25953/g.55271  ORF Transcript_25953/g.55271 Transcript_25953/m.55271 type:complete len:228 (-) Transcript_25953:506-1189(-)
MLQTNSTPLSMDELMCPGKWQINKISTRGITGPPDSFADFSESWHGRDQKTLHVGRRLQHAARGITEQHADESFPCTECTAAIFRFAGESTVSRIQHCKRGGKNLRPVLLEKLAGHWNQRLCFLPNLTELLEQTANRDLMQRLVVRQYLLVKLDLSLSLNLQDPLVLLLVVQHNHGSSSPGTACTTSLVNVLRRVLGRSKHDHQLQPVHIQPPSSNGRGHQDLDHPR